MKYVKQWPVDSCADGNAALEKVSGEEDYDLLLVDYDLPGANGLEIINHARELDHRCSTPIVVRWRPQPGKLEQTYSCKKPQDIGSLVETINSLLAEREQEQ